MEWPDVQALLEHWREHPPTHELLAAFVGFKPPDPAPVHTDDDGDSLEAQQFVTQHTREEFAALLAAHGLPH